MCIRVNKKKWKPNAHCPSIDWLIKIHFSLYLSIDSIGMITTTTTTTTTITTIIIIIKIIIIIIYVIS